MCKIQMLRALVTERLTVAVEEIFVVLESTIAEYEDELSRTRADNVRQRRRPVFEHQLESHKVVCEEVPPPEQQDWRFTVEQNEPQQPCIKEEEEESRPPRIDDEDTDNICQEENRLEELEEADMNASEEDHPSEQRQWSQVESQPPHVKEEEQMWLQKDADVSKFPVTSVIVKSEDDENGAQWLQLDCSQRRLEAGHFLAPLSDKEKMPHSPDSDDADFRGDINKHFKCSQCDETFDRKTTLKGHMMIHTGGKTIRCSVCDVGEVAFPPELQVWGTRMEQEEPKPPHLKEEHVCTREDADISKFAVTHEAAKSENDEDEARLSQLDESQSSEKRRWEADGLLAALPDVRMDQEESQSPHVKEEEEEEQGWTRQDADVRKFPVIRVIVKSEEDEDESQWSQRDNGQGEEKRRSDTTSQSPDTDDYEDLNAKTRHADKKHFKCSQCDKTFGERWILKRHIRVHTVGKPFFCSVCSKSFKVEEYLIIHMRTHTGEKPFICSICGRRFSLKSSLMKHTRTHTGEKPFSCSICGKTFAAKGHLTAHTRTHTGEKPYSCSVCNTSFSDCSALGRHTRTHTGEKPFICSLCGKRFAQKGNLMAHMNRHTGDKPFSCSFCGQTFSRKGILLKHTRRHTGEKPFRCDMCNKSFTYKYQLNKHKCADVKH
ncbi:zinc finger protein 773-like isoform X2 [Nerophis ophidion]|uniref:zinc finger protein 773-like isoform X2 n=1 Tax=Nerophis ophidion TaxID=159077 RepID=UPI002AE006BC|nr:zinc finger protein 773-like isoform X2 [Nerophis ophidion]